MKYKILNIKTPSFRTVKGKKSENFIQSTKEKILYKYTCMCQTT